MSGALDMLNNRLDDRHAVISVVDSRNRIVAGAILRGASTRAATIAPVLTPGADATGDDATNGTRKIQGLT